MLDLIIRGGRVVTADSAAEMDVGVQGERIAVIALPGTLDVEARRTIDASGKILLPGGIDPHTHIGVRVPDYWAGGRTEVFTQPPEAASRAAAFGESPHLSISRAAYRSPLAKRLQPTP